jgi:hypothetical protein
VCPQSRQGLADDINKGSHKFFCGCDRPRRAFRRDQIARATTPAPTLDTQAGANWFPMSWTGLFHR